MKSQSWRLANQTAAPRTGRGRHGHYHRRPRNIGVRRFLVGELGSLRGVAVPPNAWDDLKIAANRNRNWKRHRLTQWRAA